MKSGGVVIIRPTTQVTSESPLNRFQSAASKQFVSPKGGSALVVPMPSTSLKKQSTTTHVLDISNEEYGQQHELTTGKKEQSQNSLIHIRNKRT
jgi:hypothetical protein